MNIGGLGLAGSGGSAAYPPGVQVDHACPVARALKLGLADGSPLQPSWCLSYRREVVARLPDCDATSPELLLWEDGPLTLYYAPFDWVNTAARVMLVGITPGAHQAAEALREAQGCLRAGYSSEDTLRRADAAGSFSGRMRANLTGMLDGVGLADALGIDSTARLFDSDQHLAAHASAIDFPVFANGRNYGGASPGLTRHPLLRSLVRASLGARLDMAPDALIVPLGKAARDALTFLAAGGLVDPARCLQGFPHPSGGNGWRVRQYTAQRRALASQIARWAASTHPGQRGDYSVPGLSAAPQPSSPPEPRAAAKLGNIQAPDRARIVIRLTAGNVNHSYVSLARHLGFFPADAIGPASSKDGTGALLTLGFAGIPGITQTDIAGGHKVFRDRKTWRAYFACHGLTDGDSIFIERVSDYEYRITPAP